MNRMSQPRLTTWYLNMKAGYMKRVDILHKAWVRSRKRWRGG